MKIKLKDIKQIVEEVVQDAISEQEQEEAPAPEAASKVRDSEKAQVKMDAQKALITLLQFIDTPIEIEDFVKSLVQRLDPNKVTDQELIVAFKKLFDAARSKDLERQGKAAAGE